LPQRGLRAHVNPFTQESLSFRESLLRQRKLSPEASSSLNDLCRALGALFTPSKFGVSLHLDCCTISYFIKMRDYIASIAAILAFGVFLSATLTFATPFNFGAKAYSQPAHLLSEPRLLQTRGGNSLPTGTCNAQTECPITACCGTNGLCGYSPSECGQGNCTSKCTSKAECGQYGVPGKQNCPLGVCCSKFGYVLIHWLARGSSLIVPSGFAVQLTTSVL
jgi:hypothetical protein